PTAEFFVEVLGILCTTIRDSLRGLHKSLDAPKPRGRVSNPPLRLPILFTLFAFFAAILFFVCGFAALGVLSITCP
ncbi:MAG: hypothetical protein ACXW6K_22055, partial [Candidatus Binatia bacterium]